MIEVKFYEQAPDELLEFAVIAARAQGKWVFCKHHQRDTYEFPGGHREAGETILEAAHRELREETGALEYSLHPVCVYSVTGKNRINSSGEETFGMLFFADISHFESELHHEMEQVLLTEALPFHWTYPLIQPKLMEEVQRRGLI